VCGVWLPRSAGVRTVPCPYSLCCCKNLRVRPAPGEISRPT
jgi:hypothetical protein